MDEMNFTDLKLIYMNAFGRKFRVTIFGESHGEAVGVVLDGVPAGLELSEADFDKDVAQIDLSSSVVCSRIIPPEHR